MKEYFLVRVKSLSDAEIQNITGMNLGYLEENYEGTCYKVFKTHTYIPLVRYMRHVFLNLPPRGYYVVYVEPIYKFDKRVGQDFAKTMGFTDDQSNALNGYFSIPLAYFNRCYKDILKSMGIKNLEYKKDEDILFMVKDH